MNTKDMKGITPFDNGRIEKYYNYFSNISIKKKIFFKKAYKTENLAFFLSRHVYSKNFFLKN
jgi:hypothetical protein